MRNGARPSSPWSSSKRPEAAPPSALASPSTSSSIAVRQGRGARLVAPVLERCPRRRLGGARPDEPRGRGAELARAAVARGFRTVVAVGGDEPGATSAARSSAPAGRCASASFPPDGCDLAKSLGIPGADVAACARIILAGHSRTIDVGRVLPDDRYFLNVAGFGYDIAVIEDSWNVRGWGAARSTSTAPCGRSTASPASRWRWPRKGSRPRVASC